MRKSILVDGGIGRITCSLPAIEEYCKRYKDTVVITAGLDVFMNNPFIKRVYPTNMPYIWDDIISKTKFVRPEPYENYNYYKQKIHLIQAFFEELGLKIPKDIPKPNIYLQDEEILQAKNTINHIKQTQGKDKTILFQPFGAAAKLTNEGHIFDNTHRSLSIEHAKRIKYELMNKFNVIEMSNLPPYDETAQLTRPGQQLMIRHWISLINEIDAVVGIDSCSQHFAYSFNKPAFILFGSMYPENVGYIDKQVIWQKKGFPEAYNPLRIPTNNMMMFPEYNKGAMDFNEDLPLILKEIYIFLEKLK